MSPGEVLAVIAAAVLAAVLTFVILKTIDRLRRKDAESEAREIVARAERDCHGAAP